MFQDEVEEARRLMGSGEWLMSDASNRSAPFSQVGLINSPIQMARREASS